MQLAKRMDYIRFGSRMILWFGNRGAATKGNNGHIYNNELFHFKKAISLIYGDNIKSHVTQPSHSVPCSFSNTPVAFMPAPPLLVDSRKTTTVSYLCPCWQRPSAEIRSGRSLQCNTAGNSDFLHVPGLNFLDREPLFRPAACGWAQTFGTSGTPWCTCIDLPRVFPSLDGDRCLSFIARVSGLKLLFG